MPGNHCSILGPALLAAVLLSSCGGASAPDPSTATASDADISTTIAAEPVEGPTTTSAAVDDTPEEVETVDVELRTELGIADLELVTSLAGEGARPELAWTPVAGATLYSVTVFDPDGFAYWSWEGTATTVHVGGEPMIEPGRPGPSIVDGMTWRVSAHGEDFTLIALSPTRPISP